MSKAVLALSERRRAAAASCSCTAEAEQRVLLERKAHLGQFASAANGMITWCHGGRGEYSSPVRSVRFGGVDP